MRILLVFNPNAANGRAASLLDRVREILSAGGVEADIELTEHRGHAVDIVREANQSGLRYPRMHQTNRYRWIIFDADGTLFDYDGAELNALEATFEHFGLDFTERAHAVFAAANARLWDAFEKGRVSSVRLRVERFEELAREMRFEYVAAEVSQRYLAILGTQCGLLPGAFDLIEELSSTFGLVLATNGLAEVQRQRFAASDIRPFFSEIVISDEIGVAKPDPRFFDEVFSRIGDPDRVEVLMVGDGLTSDIAGGAGYEIDTCWFNPAGLQNGASEAPTYEIRHLDEVVGIVKRVNR